MTSENLVINREDQIALITLNRPKALNALNKQTIQELHDELVKLRDNDDIRVVVITGSGDKAFVAGADIREFSDFDVKQGTELAAQGQELLFDLVENFNKPVIAAINGYALGGGLELAMACQIRVASENAQMGLPETGLGLIPGYGGTQRLAQLVGRGRALEMIATAQRVSAQRAYEMGLVNHVTSAAELLDKCREIAKGICRNSPQAISMAISSVNAGFKEGQNGFKAEIEAFGKCFGTRDFKEGTTAFLEKRKPQF